MQPLTRLDGDAAALPHAEHDRAEAALAQVLQVRDGVEAALLGSYSVAS